MAGGGTVCTRLANGTVIECVESSVPYISLYFLFLGMLLGALTLWGQMKFAPWFPYTALLFLEGIILGGVNEATGEGLGDLSKSMATWIEIDPFLLMAVFLPALIFADAMRINVHQFQTTAFWPSLLLAGPGVVVNAGIMSAVAMWILDYGWDWYACLMFGAVLGATDPVAVVAMVESSNVPARLMLLMSSESHLADLTVLVMFKFFLDLITQGGALLETTETTVKFFVVMLVVGPLVGLAFGFASNFLIRLSVSPTRSSDTMVQISVTIVCAYLSFLVSEHNFHSNGILASVASGWVIAAYSWPKFAKREVMEHVWSAIEYFGNTMIFLLAGVILGSSAYSFLREELTMQDWLNVLIVWGFIFASRFVIVLAGFPFLYLTSKKQFKPTEAVALVFGGIRGAVTVTLAIVVLNTSESVQYEEELIIHFGPNYKSALRKFFFLIGSITLLTLVVNYTLFPYLTRCLRISSKSKSKKKLHDHVRTRILKNASTLYREIRDTPGYEHISMEDIQQIVSTAKRGRKSLVDPKMQRDAETALTVDPNAVELGDCNLNFLKQVRVMFLSAVRAQYWEQINEGKLPRKSKAALVLLNAVEIAMDDVHMRLDDLSPLRLFELLDRVSCSERMLSCVDKCLPECVTLDNYYFFRVKNARREEGIYLATSFIEAHIYAEERIAQFVGEDESIDTPEEAYVIKESRELRKRVEDFLKLACDDDEEIVKQVHVIKMASSIIEKQRLFIENLASEGLIDDKFLEEQMDVVREDQTRLEKKRRERFRNLASKRASVAIRRHHRNLSDSSDLDDAQISPKEP